MIEEGVKLMLIGMGVVFSFLILLVLLMKISGRFFSRFPEFGISMDQAKPGSHKEMYAAHVDRSEVAVAIAVAYRKIRGG